ncbi:MAG: transposase [Chitinophagaceae bacterium]
MNAYNTNLHHRKSIRLKEYDYTQPGFYFITICCRNKAHRFGEVIVSNDNNAQMMLNQFGQIAQNEWLNTANIRSNIKLLEFVIMPNHMHGIIYVTRRGELHSPFNNELHSPTNNELHSPFNNELHSPTNNEGVCKTPLRSPSQTIGAIIRGYKAAVTKKMALLGFKEQLWQRNYYEHIIRDEKSYLYISNYIINNPLKWKEDKFYNE